jgi:hypothetical protein
MFGEVITNNFQSHTPVEGAQLFVGATPDINILSGLELYRDATFTIDVNNTRSADGSLKVTSQPIGGVQSSILRLEDFLNTHISFDLYYPSSAVAAGQELLAGLMNERGHILQLLMPVITGNGWQNVQLRLNKAVREQTGRYRLILVQNTGTATWWIDNFKVTQRSVSWAGRATFDDPWGRFNNRWIEFDNLVNSTTDGILFDKRGKSLQIRGRTLTQNARIDKMYVKPKYAELGRFTWDVGRRYRD